MMASTDTGVTMTSGVPVMPSGTVGYDARVRALRITTLR
jgi:hypothetical protein